AALTEFVDGLGPRQLVGRQVLGAALPWRDPAEKGHLEVEVIRARGLYAKKGAKLLPAPYVKVYLLEVTRRTLDPLYQQQLIFLEEFRGKILQGKQSGGDCGRIDPQSIHGHVPSSNASSVDTVSVAASLPPR
uniref:C2 domain-containing protein n=1 Tax=Macrostomum lignano TaxID=282301 RepID=A0A1I8FCV5_9PLAT